MFYPSTDQKIALFLADGCEEIEALTVADLAYRAGIPCTKVSVSDSLTVTSSHDIVIMADMTVKDLPFDKYDMIVLPGGVPGTDNLRECKLLKDNIISFLEEGKAVAAICAAPSILALLGLLKGVRATCYPSMEVILKTSGAEYTEDPVVVSGNIITSRGVGTAIPFALSIIEYLVGKEAAEEAGGSILYC